MRLHIHYPQIRVLLIRVRIGCPFFGAVQILIVHFSGYNLDIIKVKDLQIKVKWQNEGFTKLSQKKNRHDKQTAEAA